MVGPRGARDLESAGRGQGLKRGPARTWTTLNLTGSEAVVAVAAGAVAMAAATATVQGQVRPENPMVLRGVRELRIAVRG